MKDARPTIVALLAFLAVCASAGNVNLESSAGASATARPQTLVFAGDSTLDDHGGDETIYGSWGSSLRPFLRDGCAIVNWGRSGRSTKSFISEGWWEKALDSANAGDFVLIQFGHNDQKVDLPFGAPIPQYKENLARMAEDVRAKGATPIFATPIVRLSYGPDGKVADLALEEWANAMRETAADIGVNLVDMRALTRKAADTAGEKEALTWNVAGDRTHPAPKGARLYARLFLAEIRRLGLPVAGLFVQEQDSFAPCTSTGTIDLESPAGRISLDEKNGSVVALVPAGGGASIWRSDPCTGLWMTSDKAGHLEKAAEFSSADDAAKRFSCERRDGSLALRYEAAAYSVEVAVVPTAHGFELRGRVETGESLASPIAEFWLPPKIRFAPEETEDLVFPMLGNYGIGTAYSGKWFMDQNTLPPLGSTNAWTQFNNYRISYPAAFSDFIHLRKKDGTGCAVYGIQRIPEHAAYSVPEPMFIPTQLETGGDVNGGYASHSYPVWLKPGEVWDAPPVALDIASDYRDALFRYAEANGVCRKTFAEKAPAEFGEKLKVATLLNLRGSAKQKSSLLDRLPKPTLIHFVEYLKGGHDKEYPEHLPPNPSFGTAEEFRRFIDEAHEKGHIVMPYTNPTWWCDHPRCDTFLAAGEAPLTMKEDGTHGYERYSATQDGWRITYWHPAVVAANRETVRAFIEDYPVDINFQDQIGARGWVRDFNPVAPSPMAYVQGMLEMNVEDAKKTPLATEGGWDRVADNEVMFCGLGFWIGQRSGQTNCITGKRKWRPDTWRIEPLALYLTHDRMFYTFHDLGHFTERPKNLAHAIAFGFSTSTIFVLPMYQDPEKRLEHIRQQAEVQRNVVSRYALKPLTAFRHDFGPALAAGSDPLGDDDGTVVAEYGDVKVVANLGPVTRVVDGVELEPFGFKVVDITND